LRHRIVRQLPTAVAISLALVAIVVSFRQLDWPLLVAQLRSASHLAPLLLVPQGVSMAVEAWAWAWSIEQVGHRVRLADILAIRVATESVCQLAPGGAVLADSLKPILLHRRVDLSIPAAIGATVYRKYLRLLGQGPYVLLAAVVGAPAVLALSQLWLESSLLFWALLGVGVMLGLASLAMGLGFRHVGLAMVLFRALERVRLVRSAVQSARKSFEECDQAARAFFRLSPRQVALPAIASGACWALEGAETWLALRATGVDLPLSLVLGLDVTISLARQLLVFLPAGVGLQEAGYLAALSALGIPSPVETAAALSVLKRGKELVWGVLGFSLLAPLGSDGQTSRLAEGDGAAAS